MKIAISAGHGMKVQGAIGPSPWGLNEVDEARKVCNGVVSRLADYAGPFFDDVSTSQNENLNRIVDWHNSQQRDLDVSVHFNANVPTSNPMGTECLYVTQESLADQVAAAMAAAGHFKDRGPKYRSDLFFLNQTSKPSILLEVCFVDSQGDIDLYHQHFDAICQAIAQTVAPELVQQPGPQPPERPQRPQPPGQKPTLSRGDSGPDVVYLQEQLNEDNDAGLDIDGDFGPATESAVKDYQASRSLDVDGIVGPATWEALESDAPPVEVPGLPPRLTGEQQNAIIQIAKDSDIYDYSWDDRGEAPEGYMQGFALSFANVYRKFIIGHQPALEMAKARSSSDKDVFNVYKSKFDNLSMNNDTAGSEALRHLYALLLGLGMRESSGQHCCGRDMSADNVTSDTCEAGLYQTSYNAHSCAVEFDQTFEEYQAGGATGNPQGFLDTFAQGVTCSSSDWSCYGSGNGYEFQQMCKNQPAFAVETCAITLRNLCNHYGPINRQEAELRPEADDMLQAVQDYIDGQNAELVAVAELVDETVDEKPKPRPKPKQKKPEKPAKKNPPRARKKLRRKF